MQVHGVTQNDLGGYEVKIRHIWSISVPEAKIGAVLLYD